MASASEIHSPPVASGPLVDDILRGEPFGIEHLEQHARELARRLPRDTRPRSSAPFQARWEENARILRQAREAIAAGVQAGDPLTSDTEWLLDNFHIVEEQLREIVDDLPPRFLSELPKLESGEPRIYPLALELLVHTDSALDEEVIVRCVSAFQEVTPLSIGETWAIPIMLRLGLVENLRRIATQLMANRRARESADRVLKKRQPQCDFELDTTSIDRCSAIVPRLIEHLQLLAPEETEARERLESQLARCGYTLDAIVHHHHCRQAANQVSIGNVITSMRLISSLDWVEFFERTNTAEAILRQDPAGIYSAMDFATRDRYRHALEQLSNGSRRSNQHVAEQVIELAEAGDSETQRHVGYYLIGEGRSRLQERLEYRPRLQDEVRRSILRHPGLTYFGTIAAVSASLGVLLLLLLRWAGATEATTAVIGLLGLPLIVELAVQVTNLLVTTRLAPRLLPKLEFKEGIPDECPTFVVIPAKISETHDVESLTERLELHFLANPEPALRFALLTDFGDDTSEHVEGDEALLGRAQQRIQELNARHAAGASPIFFLFHRKRLWNPGEQAWMGWERKRGKLVEFNRLLRGATQTSFVATDGPASPSEVIASLPRIEFVLTLDADTRLPHGAARRLIGAASHPLNRPRFDARSERIVAGYALLQPRLMCDLGSANRSRFSQMFANSPGIDPYATCASDVYQDLFGEGTFTGKGLYDVDALAATLEGVFPENHILSHDLIEGCHTRTALVSDVELVDGAPSTYEAEANRQQRWVRGDWQLLPWLFPRVPSVSGWRRNPLSLLSRWKVVDNLRRSLLAPAVVVFLLVGWLLVPRLAFAWTGLALAVLAFPILTQVLWGITGRYVRPVGLEGNDRFPDEFTRSLVQCASAVSLLPHKAWLMIDAISRTLYRLVISRRRLLEWETSDATERRLKTNGGSESRLVAIPPILAVGVLAAVPWEALGWTVPFVIAWVAAPSLVRWLGEPLKVREIELSESERAELRRIARRTWAFFETVVGPEDNWLPPDNLQEYPKEKIAHRISPTNEGLFLVSALVARDFGFVTLHRLADLYDRNLGHWARLERLHGHFYNWYETTTLEPLLPRYVSTVDSGNLVAAFLTVHQGIDELLREPAFGTRVWEGLQDSIDAAEESCDLLQPRGARLVSPPLDDLIGAIRALRGPAPRQLWDWQEAIHRLATQTDALEPALAQFASEGRYAETDVVSKVGRLISHLRDLVSEWERLFGWVRRLPESTAADRTGEVALQGLVQILHEAVSLRLLAQLDERCAPAFSELRASPAKSAAESQPGGRPPLAELESAVRHSAEAARELVETFELLSSAMESFARGMDFRFLYNRDRRLFSVGFNLEENRLDRAHYDLLCSEARLASYLAIAKGDVEYRHWFQLGRPMTRTGGSSALLSWGGTMFEYLMPALFQKTERGSLLDQSMRAAVARQIEYGRQHGVPWGISESAFGALAVNTDYHYQSFGAPGLGLKRGLGRDMVVSPYSTMLAVEVDSKAALKNLRWLADEHGYSSWGYYDAIDYTRERVPSGSRSIIVRCYMSHHQGMGMVAISNLLHAGNTRRRFHSHPLGKTCELLLQERVPANPAELQPHGEEVDATGTPQEGYELVRRRVAGIDAGPPRTHLLSNGEYSVLLSNAGGGFSRCNDMAMSRWRPDSTTDAWGQFIYLRDLATDHVWSATYQPTRAVPDSYEVVYSIDKAEFYRRDGSIESHLEITVSPENNAEVRQLRITNHGDRTAEIEVTSYAEVVLNPDSADLAHRAFQGLFVQTEFVPSEAALLAWRRPRDAGTPEVWGIHVLSAHGSECHDIQYETSREAFLGRRGTSADPKALLSDLGGHTGTVLDPIFSLRCRVSIPAEESISLAFVTAHATSREEAIILADQYHDPREVQRAFELAWAFKQVELRHLQISPADSHQYQRLLSPLLYPDRRWRAPAETLLSNRQGQSALWRYGISGDIPILLVRLSKPEQVQLVAELFQAHEFWRRNGLKIDLAVLNDYPGSYFDAVHEQLVARTAGRRHAEERTGKIYLLRGSQIPQEDRALLESAAAVVWNVERGTVARQLESLEREQGMTTSRQSLARLSLPASRLRKQARPGRSEGEPRLLPRQPAHRIEANTSPAHQNGFGGFRENGTEYQIVHSDGGPTPMPWSNVVANPTFGFLITESGGGYTWAGNSREYKLTTWSNDPVCDPPSEVLYLRNEDTGEIIRPLNDRSVVDAECETIHAAGSSQFRLLHAGLRIEAVVSIAPDDSVKFIRLSLKNTTGSRIRLSAVYYVEWVLGVNREQTQLHVRTSLDENVNALLARNPYHPEMPERVSFLTATSEERSFTGDRTEFLGRHGTLHEPAGLSTAALSGRTGAGLDPCGAVRAGFTLAPSEEREIHFLLGSGKNEAEAIDLIARFNTNEAARQAMEATRERWNHDLSAILVRTPVPSLDLMVNRWLLYQVLSCRVWGRTAFYQCGGAYGFRDQLQDGMALVYSRPELTRQHLLLAASRQFEEGDVQHWWHPPLGRGTRTRYSDDALWLPYTTCHYAFVTGDRSVWDEDVSFLTSPVLEPHEDERYELPNVSIERRSLYEHCRRAFMRAFRTGPHGIPLMGGGDWNDGMNKVGALGEGESVWLGWFLLVLAKQFLPVMRTRERSEVIQNIEAQLDQIRTALESAWDGEWYRRAYFDDGSPLGSRENVECQIDSLSQSWAVFAGADPARCRQAMESVWHRLIDNDVKLARLFTPPFDKGPENPGYVKGYPPGIRENGGQYTHATTWLVKSFAALGDAERALAVFQMINPADRSSSPELAERYRVEPYVVAADVYGVDPYRGRGGWTWYTGSASWTYRVALEDILGFRLAGNRLRIVPCIPETWNEYEIQFRRGETRYRILVVNRPAGSEAASSIVVDGHPRPGTECDLLEDGRSHEIVVHWVSAHRARDLYGDESAASRNGGVNSTPGLLVRIPEHRD